MNDNLKSIFGQTTNSDSTGPTGPIGPTGPSSVTSSQLLLQRVETTNDNATFIAGDTLSTLSSSSSGVHVGFAAISQQGSIYSKSLGGVVSDLNINLPFTGGVGTVNMGGMRVDTIKNFTPAGAVKIQDGYQFLGDTTTLTNSNTVNINSSNVSPSASIINLQNSGTTKLSIAPTLVRAIPNIQADANIVMPNATSTINIASNQCILANNRLKIIGGASDTCHIATANDNTGWIAGSFGYEFGTTPIPKVVMGTLNNRAGLGGHIFNGSFISWADLDINFGSPVGGVKIGANAYESANALSIGGNGICDLYNYYAIQNNKILAIDGLTLRDNNTGSFAEILKHNLLHMKSVDKSSIVLEQIFDRTLSAGISIGKTSNNKGISIGIYDNGSGPRRVIQACKFDSSGCIGEQEDLYINNNTSNTHFMADSYESANAVSIGGYCDTNRGYKVNNIVSLFADTSNTFIYNNTGLLCLIDNSGNFKIDTPSAALYIGLNLVTDASNHYFKNGGITSVLGTNDLVGNTFKLPSKPSGTFVLATTADVSAGKTIYWNNINTINITGTYITCAIITWNGIFSCIPFSVSVSCENSSGLTSSFTFRLTNNDASTVFFESPTNTVGTGAGILRYFSSNVITAITGATPTTPLLLQIKLISGTSITHYSGSCPST